jgi:purine-binding chemotaxis protein CheW
VPIAAAPGGGEKLLVFDLHREKYAIPIHDITLIIDEREITPVPNAPPFLRGILTLRGKIVNVLDVATRLGIRRPSDPSGRKIVILDLGADHFGLLVDGIEQLVEVDVQSLEPPPDGFRPVIQEYVEGVFHHGGRAVAFLNLPLFLTFEL